MVVADDEVRIDLGDGEDSPWAGDGIPVPSRPTSYRWERNERDRSSKDAPRTDDAEPSEDPPHSGDRQPTATNPQIDDDKPAPDAGVVGVLRVEANSDEGRPATADGPPEPGRHRWQRAIGAVTALAFAVLAVGLLGRSGDNGESRAIEGAADTVPADDTAESAPANSVVSAEAQPSRTVEGFETGLFLVALERSGDVITLDLDARVQRRYEGRSVEGSAPVYLFPDAAGVTAVPFDGVPGFRLDWATGVTEIEPGDQPTGRLYPGPGPGTAWRETPDSPDDLVAFDLIDDEGMLLGSRIEVQPGAPLGADGRGGLLVNSVEQVIAATPDGSEFITSGEVVAAGANVIWVRECEVQPSCDLVRIERDTGTRTLVPTASVELVLPGRGSLGSLGETVAPDGQAALVRRSPNALTWVVVDLARSAHVRVPAPKDASPVVWSADGRYVVWLSESTIHLYDRDSESLVMLDELPALRSFAAAEAIPRIVATPEPTDF
jgi:hypothetical protein